jgi:hypothetical protein
MPLGFDDSFFRPEIDRLLTEGNIVAFGRPSGLPAGLAIEHEGQEAVRLGFGGRLASKQSPKIDCFIGEATASLVESCQIIPPGAVGGVEKILASCRPGKPDFYKSLKKSFGAGVQPGNESAVRSRNADFRLKSLHFLRAK